MSAAEDAYRAAERYIAEAKESRATSLHLNRNNDNNALVVLPPSIETLKEVRWIDLHGTSVSDISPISNIPNIMGLNLQDTSELTSIEAIRGKNHLLYLNLSGSNIRSLDVLTEMRELEVLLLAHLPTTNVGFLHDKKALRVLDLSSSLVDNINDLRKLAKIQWLNLQYSKVSEINPIRGMSYLQALNLYGCPIFDLNPVRDLQALQSLDVGQTLIPDIRAITYLPNLSTTSGSRIEWKHCVFLNAGGVNFAGTPATRLDSELARLSKIKNDADRTSQTLAYLRSLTDDWPPEQTAAEAAQTAPREAEHTTPAPSDTLRTQASLLLQCAPIARDTASTLAQQLEHVISLFLQEAGANHLPEELQVYDDLRAALLLTTQGAATGDAAQTASGLAATEEATQALANQLADELHRALDEIDRLQTECARWKRKFAIADQKLDFAMAEARKETFSGTLPKHAAIAFAYTAVPASILVPLHYLLPSGSTAVVALGSAIGALLQNVSDK